ncbi:hypothetical protein GCM10023194_42120 [Planotetraspora phitsanulokensis]|uniref:Lipoprotein n=1 Tax=Planotetraspora phitsanulokensis TaxID=575192 RepID=A0A8J3UF11_9ACTN|nr:hypothetical protein [Planotetraspora phitsanulokensis]GII37815.1 hypothetical protein Pph01_28180 [Planotetraspora phitsanulokensis]
MRLTAAPTTVSISKTRRFAALCLLTVGLVAPAATSCGSPGSATGADDGTEIPVYVLNFHGAEEGRSDQRPGDLTLSEFSTLNQVVWQSWGPTKAAGSGKLTGTWCLPGCMDRPYEATVTLSNVSPVKGKGYFTKYEITAPVPEELREKADLTGALPTP